MSKDRVGWWEGRDCRAPLRCLVRSWSLLLAPSAVLTWLCTSHLQGIINLGTSENKLCFDLLSRRVSPTAPLSGIPSSEGLSSLGFPGMLPPESWLLASVAPVLESGDPALHLTCEADRCPSGSSRDPGNETGCKRHRPEIPGTQGYLTVRGYLSRYISPFFFLLILWSLHYVSFL